MFALIVDDFAIQYIGGAHLDHLCQALKKHYKVSEEINSTRFAGMMLKWNYSQRLVPALGLLANLKETRVVKRACQVEATSIKSVVNE